MNTEHCRLRVGAFTVSRKAARALICESPWLGTFKVAGFVAIPELIGMDPAPFRVRYVRVD